MLSSNTLAFKSVRCTCSQPSSAATTHSSRLRSRSMAFTGDAAVVEVNSRSAEEEEEEARAPRRWRRTQQPRSTSRSEGGFAGTQRSRTMGGRTVREVTQCGGKAGENAVGAAARGVTMAKGGLHLGEKLLQDRSTSEKQPCASARTRRS
jgi:hypothetical protein